MKKNKFDPLFIFGLLLLSITQIIYYTFGIPEPIKEFQMGMACGLVIFGAFKTQFSHKFANSKIRKWKLGMIEKIKNI